MFSQRLNDGNHGYNGHSERMNEKQKQHLNRLHHYLAICSAATIDTISTPYGFHHKRGYGSNIEFYAHEMHYQYIR